MGEALLSPAHGHLHATNRDPRHWALSVTHIPTRVILEKCVRSLKSLQALPLKVESSSILSRRPPSPA